MQYLVQILEHLRHKDKPFFVLNSHAGLGLYNLNSDEARKTGEAEDGMGDFSDTNFRQSPRTSNSLGQ